MAKKTVSKTTRKAGNRIIKTTTTTVVEEVDVNKFENDFIIVLDSSGSMIDYKSAVIEAFNKEVEAIRIHAKSSGQPTRVSLYTIGEAGAAPVVQKFFRQDVDMLAPLTSNSYRPHGGTPLLKGILSALSHFDRCPDAANPNVSVVLHVITDGQENESGAETCRLAVAKLATVEKTGRYTVAFMGPRGCRGYLSQYGIKPDNILEWEGAAGMLDSVVHTSSGVSTYFANRGAGGQSISSFYVQPDLSKVDLNKLTDLSRNFKTMQVDKEVEIKLFVETRMGLSYTPGNAYYQLMKTEKRVADNKDVLIQDKHSKRIFGGREARTTIGLPHSGMAKVEPGNHANYDIFIQSLSTNRKLPRGTKVLVRVL